MAEFQEVMRQWKRRCEHCDKDEAGECSINGYVCKGFYKMRNYINPEFIECDVMQWAAEHPDPVYPTWGEWLISVGAARKIPTDIPFELEDGRIVDSPWETVVDVNTPIPADIAQKLGIEPKEAR